MAQTGTTSVEGLTSQILQALHDVDLILSSEHETLSHATFESLKATVDRLSSRSMITYEQVEREEAALEPEAEDIVSHGSHEARVFEAVHNAMGGLSIKELESKIGDKNVAKLGQGKAFKAKWIKKDGDRVVPLVGVSP
jgi:phenylalanyl-tRNA synthetase alpha chain